jgi:hypothetical protein
MTKEQIIEGNKMIAEFMGVDIDNYTSHEDEGRKCYNQNDLLYNSCWNWLMLVVEKIESLEEGVEVDHPWFVVIEGNYCRIYSTEFSTFGQEFICENGENKITAVWETIVAFAEAFNNKLL